ncbi:hypothetical protein DFP72DRAFT_419124 [Ephemerocybe angulata]|uniref:Uncharacterized protein n=1 Tax=Ephemerocybe angulata TaxID=980116 RepID=A0A8H6IEY0_9AGAR|nr:hypothetical protein DFP72DRAFT_419124 [Tulosesus angulatus]
MSDHETHPTPTAAYEIALSEWLRPTGAYSYFPYTYNSDGYPSSDYYGYPEATARAGGYNTSLGQQGPTTSRSANYFFGFLITFIILLLIFAACGIRRRRRIAALRRHERAEELLNGGSYRGPGAIAFGGLLGDTRAQERDSRRLLNEQLLKAKPSYHEVRPDVGIGERGPLGDLKLKSKAEAEDSSSTSVGLRMDGNVSNNIIQPFAASIVRIPRDIYPYQHLNETLASSSMQGVLNPHPGSGTSSFSSAYPSTRDTLPPYEAVESGRWYSRLLPSWAPGASEIEMNLINEKTQRGASSGASVDSRSQSRGSEDVQVAVLVAMPDANRPVAASRELLERDGQYQPLPEYQIGVATLRLAETQREGA